MHLFYNPNATNTDKEITFSKDESKHVINVLRLKKGDELKITNGKGWMFSGIIKDDHSKSCTVKILSKDFKEPLPYELHLAVAPTKMNDRYEWFLEKSTEIGIHTITPIICDNSERRQIKETRMERIIQSALKQSLQSYKPHLNKATSFKNFIDQHHSGQLFIAHCEETKKTSLKSIANPEGKVTILIGPEGDFSEDEISLAIKNNFVPISLGPNRLRTETAAIAACHSISFINQ